MAAPMIPPAAAPDFLAKHGWEGAEIRPLAGDASFRRYFRVHRTSGETAVLMDAPPEHEDLGPFLTVAGHLLDRGFHPPRPLAIDRERGFLLLEDFGDDRVGPLLEREPERERDIYEAAVDILARLATQEAPSDLPPYEDSALSREVTLFTDWYAPSIDLNVNEGTFLPAWRKVWGDVLRASRRRPVIVLRDYHADNLMVLPNRDELGLLDFQDALAGHPAYDLVSLLQDARRDVPPELEEAMIDRYCTAAGVPDRDGFRAHYETLGAQRNTKILGIFTRLWKRDGKDHYLALHPRVWNYLERNLAHPALEPVRAWFDENVPREVRGVAWEDGARPVQRRLSIHIERHAAKLAAVGDQKVRLDDRNAHLSLAVQQLERALDVIDHSNDPDLIEVAVHLRTGIDLINRCRVRNLSTSVSIIRYLVIDPSKRAMNSSLDDAWKLVIQGGVLALMQVMLNYLGVI